MSQESRNVEQFAQSVIARDVELNGGGNGKGRAGKLTTGTLSRFRTVLRTGMLIADVVIIAVAVLLVGRVPAQQDGGNQPAASQTVTPPAVVPVSGEPTQLGTATDPQDDVTGGTGTPVADPAADIVEVVIFEEGDSFVIEVKFAGSQDAAFADFSRAVRISLVFLGEDATTVALLKEIHRGVERVGRQDLDTRQVSPFPEATFETEGNVFRVRIAKSVIEEYRKKFGELAKVAVDSFHSSSPEQPGANSDQAIVNLIQG